jgi:hypothetical protein
MPSACCLWNCEPNLSAPLFTIQFQARLCLQASHRVLASKHKYGYLILGPFGMSFVSGMRRRGSKNNAAPRGAFLFTTLPSAYLISLIDTLGASFAYSTRSLIVLAWFQRGSRVLDCVAVRTNVVWWTRQRVHLRASSATVLATLPHLLTWYRQLPTASWKCTHVDRCAARTALHTRRSATCGGQRVSAEWSLTHGILGHVNRVNAALLLDE